MSSSPAARADAKGIENNKALVRRFFQTYENGTGERLTELVSHDYLDYGHEPPGIGVAGARDDYDKLTATFSAVEYEIGDMIAEGDRVAVRWTARMTHTGDFFGTPPTGRRVTLKGFSHYRIVDGRIAATWNLQDVAGLREQIQGTAEAGASKKGGDQR